MSGKAQEEPGTLMKAHPLDTEAGLISWCAVSSHAGDELPRKRGLGSSGVEFSADLDSKPEPLWILTHRKNGWRIVGLSVLYYVAFLCSFCR